MTLVGSWFVLGAGLAIGIASAGQALGQGGYFFDLTGVYSLTYANAAIAGVVNLTMLVHSGLQ